MNKKCVSMGSIARDVIKQGVDKLANAVKITLGPQGKYVVIEENDGSIHVTKDGVTVAKNIFAEDMYPELNAGISLIREASLKTLANVGDATTTSTILAQSLITHIDSELASLENFIDFRKGIDDASKDVIQAIKSRSQKIKNRDDIKHVASISANNDDKIGELVAEAIEKVTMDGIITVEEGKNTYTKLDVVNGMQFENGYLAPHFITDQSSGECILNDPYIFISDQKILRTKDIVQFLEPIAQNGGSILLIAEEFDDEVIENLKINKLNNILKCCAVKAPSFGDYRKDVLEDIAILTNGTAITYDSSIEPHNVDIKMLGRAKKVIVKKDSCQIIDGEGDKKDIDIRVGIIKSQLEREKQSNNPSEFLVDFLKARIARLSAGVCVIHVGATTELEMKELKDRIDDAICATKAAIEEGIVVGGGLNYLAIYRELFPKVKESISSYGAGYHLVLNCLPSVIEQLFANSNLEITNYSSQIDVTKNIGMDFSDFSICNLFEKGIINPAKSDRIAFENAISVAKMYLNIECLITNDIDIVNIHRV